MHPSVRVFLVLAVVVAFFSVTIWRDWSESDLTAEWFHWYVLPGILGLVAMGFVVWLLAERRRRETIQAMASRLGMHYERENAQIVSGLLAQLPLFREGRSQRARNVLRRSGSEREALVFDFSFVTGGGRSRRVHRQTVAAIRLPGTTLPQFRLSPEHLFVKIGAFFGLQDIDFDSHPEFSRKYRLAGSNEVAVRSLFQRSAISYFAREPGWSVDGDGEWLAVYRRERRVKPDELPSFFESARQVAEMFRLS